MGFFKKVGTFFKRTAAPLARKIAPAINKVTTAVGVGLIRKVTGISVPARIFTIPTRALTVPARALTVPATLSPPSEPDVEEPGGELTEASMPFPIGLAGLAGRLAGGISPAVGGAALGTAVGGLAALVGKKKKRRRRRFGLSTWEIGQLLTMKSILGARHPAVVYFGIRAVSGGR